MLLDWKIDSSLHSQEPPCYSHSLALHRGQRSKLLWECLSHSLNWLWGFFYTLKSELSSVFCRLNQLWQHHLPQNHIWEFSLQRHRYHLWLHQDHKSLHCARCERFYNCGYRWQSIAFFVVWKLCRIAIIGSQAVGSKPSWAMRACCNPLPHFHHSLWLLLEVYLFLWGQVLLYSLMLRA